MIGLNPCKIIEIQTSKENVPDTSRFSTIFHRFTSLKLSNFSKTWNYKVFISKKKRCVLVMKPKLNIWYTNAKGRQSANFYAQMLPPSNVEATREEANTP